MNQRFRKPFLISLVLAITVAFLFVIRSFLLTILVAAIASGVLYPLYGRLVRLFRGNTSVASGVTILATLVLVIGPLLTVVGLLVNQAAGISVTIRPVVERLVKEPTYAQEVLQRIPGYERIEPYREQIITSAGNLVNAAGTFLVNSLSNTTRGTVTFVFHFIILLYTMFFLLRDGPAMRDAVLARMPLSDAESQLMKDRFLSITRATLKGTLVVGFVQGVLAGIAFVVAGIPNALFWTVVMIVLSVLPLVGSAIVWVPACLILMATGNMMAGVLLAVFCALVVGSVDNVLRPRLVGQDTKMHELTILFSTLGGIATFGLMGFVIGPVLAGLFQTSWNIFAIAYQDQPGGKGD